MIIRLAKKSDMKRIIDITSQAQKYLKEKEIDQWQNNYPNEEVFNQDIEKKQLYVIQNENNNILGFSMFTLNKEAAYDNITKGQWLNNDNIYGVIHRIAVDSEYKGKSLAKEILDYFESFCKKEYVKSIRIDTHNNNVSMKSFLVKNKFTFCGYVEYDGNSRIAFEKLLF